MRQGVVYIHKPEILGGNNLNLLALTEDFTGQKRMQKSEMNA